MNNELYDIKIGKLIINNDKYYGYDKDGNRAWVNNIKDAIIWKENLPDAKTILDKHDYISGEETAELIPVKVITEYQIGEF